MTWKEISEWLAYVGAVTGIVGMITGAAGYVRAGRMKALDLRLELRKSETATRTTLDQLPGLIDHADGSRNAVHAATGNSKSGANELWRQGCAADRLAVAELQKEFPVPGNDYRALSAGDLESRLVSIDALRLKVTHMHAKYLAALAADDKTREQIRAQHTAIATRR
jgi:hypothetical protein